MSFLYQALLKQKTTKDNKVTLNASAEATQGFARNSAQEAAQVPISTTNSHVQFASSALNNNHASKSIPWYAWLTIGVLLLLIGLLAGFIYGNGIVKETDNSPAVNANTIIPVKDSSARFENVNDIALLVSTNEKTLNNSLAIIPPQAEDVQSGLNQVQVSGEGNYDDSTLKIGLDSKGNVVSELVQTGGKPISAINNTSSQSTTVTSSEPTIDKNNEMALDEVPDKMKSLFADAVKATEVEKPAKEFSLNLSTNEDVALINDLPKSILGDVPTLLYQMHIFSSDVSERWVKINGKTLYEGNEFQTGLELLEIKQDLIIWRINNTKVGQMALVDFIN